MRIGKKIICFFLVLLCITAACATESGKTEGDSGMKITINITSGSGNHTIAATLADNSSAKAFADLLSKGPVSVDMQDYGSFEKVGDLPSSLPRNDTSITTEPGDIILYQRNKITINYNTNSWSFTPIGNVEGVTPAELKKILGKGNVTAVFELAK